MNSLKYLIFLLALGILPLSGCDDDDDDIPTENLDLNINGLADLGSGYMYEGWLIVDGDPVSAGRFMVDANGTPSTVDFEIDADDLNSATAYVLTIEPEPDPDPAPSSVHLLAGDFNGNTATLSIGDSRAIGDDLTGLSGSYILATPTDGGSDSNENSGVWWLDPADGPGPSLTLANLGNNWMYEGWAVIDGIPVSTGKFNSAEGADNADPYSENIASGPPFPGEDLLTNAPAGLTFPTDLSGKSVVISVEPVPDNSQEPFLLKPLVDEVPALATDHTSYEMVNHSSGTNPTGTVSR